MVQLTLLAIAALSLVSTAAHPQPAQQVPFLAPPKQQPPPHFFSPPDDNTGEPDRKPKGGTPSSPERKAEMAALLDRYAPRFKLASTERYYPSSVKFMLDHYDFVERSNGSYFYPPNGTLSLEGLGSLPRRGRRLLLAVNVTNNPQPLLEEENAYFLYGPAGMPGGMEIGPDGRGRVHDEVYGFWVDMGRGVVDLWFYPYNLGKEVGYLGWLGNHVTDWERLRVRTVNGTACSADFNTHSGGAFSAGTYRWVDIERTPDDRPIAYVASGSHGVWPRAGKHVYAQLLNLWALVDQTDDAGAIWDTQGHVVPIEWWTGPEEGRKVAHPGNEGWLEYRGKWGNRAGTDCWWHPVVGICQLIDGPPGPNRDFDYAPDCIIGKTHKSKSTYSFYLSKNVTQQAEKLNITHIVVEQVCARPSVSQMRWEDNLTEEQLDIWTTSGSRVRYAGRAQHHATAEPCGGARSAAKAYRLALYDGLGERISTSAIRVLCIYQPGRPGWVNSGAANIRDVDEWKWLLVEPPLNRTRPRPAPHDGERDGGGPGRTPSAAGRLEASVAALLVAGGIVLIM